jgi:ribonuclease BN (tRNA processing enzyme)
MIIVTGTKRSGTSMWMQLLQAAGFPPIGDAFPRNWGKTIREANPAGFWESKLRNGIYYRTNPDPETGTYLFPEQTERRAVKVFIPGLVKTDRAFIGRVIATFRPWRQYVRSLNRLYAMERESKAREKRESDLLPPAVMSPVIEWWVENFSLLSDIITRRYPFCMVAYESILQKPDLAIRRVFDWLGEGDVEAAIQQVEPSLRTQDDLGDSPVEHGVDLEPEVIQTFDALYEVVLAQKPIDQPFIDLLNATNQRLGDRIEAAVQETAKAQLERQRRLVARRKARTGEKKDPEAPARAEKSAGIVEAHFLGSGDAFGSGGRFQTCIAIRTSEDLFLVDCGASSLIAMRQQGIDPRDVSRILITHLHGDHFGGLPFFLLDAQLVSKRAAPLTIIGPPGLENRLVEAMEVLFPGSSKVEPRFELRLVELRPRTPTAIDQIEVTAFPVAHFSGAPSYSLRVQVEHKVFVYSGDTQWTDTLIEASDQADLFVCECYVFDKEVPLHNTYRAIKEHLPRMTCKRIILAHMSEDMLLRRSEVELEMAEDDLRVTL